MKIQTIQNKGAAMKRLLTLTAVLGLVAWGTGVANANLLSNPNLDTFSVGPQTLATPTGWSVDCFKSSTGPFTDGCSSETFADFCCVRGLFFKPFQGSYPLTNYLN